MKRETKVPSGRSFREIMLEEADDATKGQEPFNSIPVWTGPSELLDALGARAGLEPKELRPADFAQVAALLQVSDGDYRRLRCVLRKVVPYGLRPNCIKALRPLPRNGAVSSEFDLLGREHLKTILVALVRQVETIQILVWLGLSGIGNIRDAVFLRFECIDLRTGLIRGRRYRSPEPFEFGTLPPLLDLLSKRRERLGPEAVYVFPELVFTEAERRESSCNRVALDKPPQATARRAVVNAMEAIGGFLRECGLGTTYTFKSLRRHMLSYWAALGVRLKTRMRICGHSSEGLHAHHEVPAGFEILRTRDLAWKYLQAIQEGHDFFVPTTSYDVYESLMQHWEKLPEIVSASMSEELHSSVAELQKVITEAFTLQMTQVEQRLAALKLAVDECRSQLPLKAAH